MSLPQVLENKMTLNFRVMYVWPITPASLPTVTQRPTRDVTGVNKGTCNLHTIASVSSCLKDATRSRILEWPPYAMCRERCALTVLCNVLAALHEPVEGHTAMLVVEGGMGGRGGREWDWWLRWTL
jgi:hypothetical protein